MNPADAASTEREIARSLATVLLPALADEASASDLQTARDAAQMLGLGGLDRVLEACHPHAGRPRPAELTPVCERVRRLVRDMNETETVRAFQDADRELAALAAELSGIEWSESFETLEGRAPAVPTLSLADVLEDLPLAAPDSPALRLRVTAPVASALRAALDWLAPAPPTPLTLRTEESTLEIVLDQVNYGGLAPAHKVLSAVGANLGPTLGAANAPIQSWVLRVPTFAGRGSWLMVTQGRLRLAIPWHSVLRISLVPASDLQSALREAPHPVLEPISPLVRTASEYPVALVGHGLKRAYFAADRLVWRLRAQPSAEASRVMPAAVVSHSIETEDGETFWAIEPGRLLERLETPSYEAPRSQSAPAVAPPTETHRDHAIPDLSTSTTEPLESAADASDTHLGDTDQPLAALESPALESPGDFTQVLGPGDVVPIPWSGSAPDVADAAADDDTGAEGAEHSTEASITRHVLVAEDSLTARVYLSRLLELNGFEVHTVTGATELVALLASQPWTALFVDVDLPDADAETFLGEVMAMQRRLGSRADVIALIRDARDGAVARAAGIPLVLHKPFDRASVERMIEQLRLTGGNN